TFRLGTGGGAFGPARTMNGGDAARLLAVGDWNGDGNDDVALGNTNSVLLFAGGPEPIFGLLGEVPSPMFQQFGAAEDVDQDGRLDCILASGSVPGTTVALGHGDGTFGDDLGTPFALPYPPAEVEMGDLNGNQQLDAVIRGSTELRTY